MKKSWIALALVFGVGLLAFAAQQAQQVQKPPIQKRIERPEEMKNPVGFITITNPKSTSKPWFAGLGTTITWTKSGVQPDNVKIELRDAGCTGGILVIAESTANDGNHFFMMPESVAAGSYTIRISGTGVQKCSEAFPVHALPYKITVPPGTWNVNSTHTITWTTNQPASTLLRLGLWRTVDASWTILKSNTPNDGSESITVPNVSGSYKILIVAPYQDYGNLEFTGGGPITIVP